MLSGISKVRSWIGGKGILLLVGLILCSGFTGSGKNGKIPGELPFDGQRAYAHVEAQMAFGPRTPGSPAHAKTIAWIKMNLLESGWQVNEQRFFYGDVWSTNLSAQRSSQPPLVLLCAHYDSRKLADRDPSQANHSKAVPGANDGASGVAVLLEIGRVLSADLTGRTRLVFLDAEDSGGIDGWEWIAGSRAYVKDLREKPKAVVLLDMIGDRDLNIYQELNSDPDLTKQIWEKAAEMGYADIFIPEPKYRMLDDHVPFIQAGIPALDIIDFDYPAWHTRGDTLDKISPSSLQAVGDVVLAWLDDFIRAEEAYGEKDP